MFNETGWHACRWRSVRRSNCAWHAHRAVTPPSRCWGRLRIVSSADHWRRTNRPHIERAKLAHCCSVVVCCTALCGVRRRTCSCRSTPRAHASEFRGICISRVTWCHVSTPHTATAFRGSSQRRRIWVERWVFSDACMRCCKSACSNVRLWKLDTQKKNEETRLDAFEMKGLKKILRVS